MNTFPRQSGKMILVLTTKIEAYINMATGEKKEGLKKQGISWQSQVCYHFTQSSDFLHAQLHTQSKVAIAKFYLSVYHLLDPKVDLIEGMNVSFDIKEEPPNQRSLAHS